jgi:hypothetical protein
LRYIFWGALVASTAGDPGAEAVVADLTRDITRLPLGAALTIAEFGVPGVAIWKVRPDSSGIPRVWYSDHDWPSLRSWAGRLNEGDLLDRLRPEDESRIVLARTGPAEPEDQAEQAASDADRACNVARAKYPDARYFRSPWPVDDLLEEATARVPLPPSLWYELVLLRRRPSGRLELTVQQLFLPEAVRGDTRPLTVRCAASDRNGTAFVVAARRAASSFELVSVSSARVPPGTYDVTATLLRPGKVRFDFDGLPVRPREDGRNWFDIRAALPDSLDEIGPVHLIVAIERCGAAAVVAERVDRATQLISQVRDGADGPVSISLVTYASHSHDRRTDDEPVTVHTWQETSAVVIERRLRALSARGPAPALYPHAAQVECMLAEVTERLRQSRDAREPAGRPALVVIGDKPPFPHRVDPRSGILPCPLRQDWRTLLRGLAENNHGVAFGVVRDVEPDDDPDNPAGDIWRLLGTDASATLAGFDARALAVRLGLLIAVPQYLPLPLAIPEGAD